MKLRLLLTALLAAFHVAVAAPFSTNGNRLAYLDSDDPFYVGRDFPKLITPQWVGEEGVEAVVILSIDDMRETPKYETFLRPILERLKRIDGRAPVSIMVNTISPTNAQLQSWLKEGVSLECHTIGHPCPLCQRGDFHAASTNYHACVDLLNAIPGNKPVAFRMPCCDSMNSPSPRFYSEIFNRTSAQGNFLGIDSSVMVVLTTNDTSLPRELVLDADGRERFRKYLPTQTNATTRVSMGSFTTTIEDYPYPYVIGKTCWEFPCIVPSDWEANNLHAPNNPKTVEDWERALDAIVLKQGVMTFIFHPHGWIKPEQMVEFIDYAVTKYGKRVKFLNFKEAQERLNKNLLAATSLRAGSGPDNGVRLLDVDNDGFLDVMNTLTFTDGVPKKWTRLWRNAPARWQDIDLPISISGEGFDRFGILNTNGYAFVRGTKSGQNWGATTGEQSSAWQFDGEQWRAAIPLELPTNDLSAYKAPRPTDDSERAGWGLHFPEFGMRLRDLDHDGICELIVGNPNFSAVYKLRTNVWRKLDYTLPSGTSIVDAQGRDAGLRFVDVDGDGYDDILFSNHERYSLHLFRKDSRDLRLKPGWSDEIISGTRGGSARAASGVPDPTISETNASQREASHLDPIPPIVRDGTNRNNGVWFARSTMWIQNEDTAHLPDKVDRRTFKQLLAFGNPPPLSPEASLKTMRARPGFKVELVASEPLIQDPIAFDWSADGRLWVLEMGDYPLGVDGKGSPGGRLRVLTDTDGDGRYDEAVTFLDKLSCPEGMHCWRNGAVVIAGKDLFYAEDTNGDGVADVREVLFTGFSEGNQQHRANGFTYGLDGWLYGANGESDGMVRAVNQRAASVPLASPQNRQQDAGGTINIRGQDFRFDPDHRLFEAIGGRTQFGLYRDDFGNWFGNNNSTWLWHHFFPVPYLSRNPLLPLKTTKRTLANYPEATRCFPISKTLSRFNDPFAYNHVTSANSPVPYRDELFGRDFATSIFISEPVHNLVHREVLEPDGVTFKSRRAADEANSEFLASSDNWFRPTMLATGPDGALYVADMYRLVIEHPQWIPVEMQKRLDLRAGADKGRIYRVLPEGAARKKIPNLAQMNSQELAAALDSPNGWQRDTAQRLLTERGDKSVVPALEHHAKSAKDAKVRIQALWALSGLNALHSDLLLSALKNNDESVREHAVKLSEGLANEPTILNALLALKADSIPRLRYQLAFTLGEWGDARAADALLQLLRDEDENIRNAALSSAPRHAATLLALAEKLPPNDRAGSALPMLRKLVANPPALAKTTAIFERASAFSPEQRAERAKVVERYASTTKLRGDSKLGAALFTQNCASCHRLRNTGVEIGPDLAMMSGKPVEQVIEAILNPNAAVEERYRSFTIVTKDGRELTGVIASETPTTITLRAANQPEQTILRGDVKEITASSLSLMPDGLESAFTPQQLADLIAFVTGR